MPLHARAKLRRRPGAPDIVLGDAHGTACSPRITRAAETLLTGMGYQVRRNDPYAGGYVTRHYGRPRESVHALQIEVARNLYMDEARFLRGTGFAALQRDLGTLCARTRPAGSGAAAHLKKWRRLAAPPSLGRKRPSGSAEARPQKNHM